jgi:glycosyltransferase involved in cell wall biosynthesis
MVGGPQRVLVVEDLAHVSHGHFPVRFAEIAEAFVANGRAVEILTSAGWVGAHGLVAGLPMHRFGVPSRALERLSQWLWDPFSTRPSTSRRRRAATVVRTVAVASATRRRRARLARDGPVDVVSVCDALDAHLFAAIAGPGRWLIDVFRAPTTGTSRFARWYSSIAVATARRAEVRRRRQGGHLVVAAPNERLRAQWAAFLPGIDVVEATFVGCRETEPIRDARARIAVDDDQGHLALLFGSGFAKHDVNVVFRAFRDLREWRLTVCGEVADQFDDGNFGPWRGPPPIVCDGFVDAETRDLVYAAADLVVLSFVPGVTASSGRLMDAIAWGVPVVCSAQSAVADIVAEYRLGVLFEPGDAASLMCAVRAAPAFLDPADLARARERFSNRAIAARQLAALDG